VTNAPQGPDSLKPLLRDAEAELTRRLQEVCEAEADGVATESSAEIRQLEDALVAAGAAARQIHSLRRRVEQTSVPPPASEGGSADTVREFTDREGRAWRAWPVTPGQSGIARTKYVLGDFQLGWICFEGIDGSARRRLPGHPERWTELTERELDILLQQAVTGRERKPPVENASAPRPDR